MKNCTQCNCPNDDNALFCRQCGAKLPEQTPYAVPVAPPATGQPIQNNFTQQQQQYAAPVQAAVNQPKKKKKGCLIAVLVFIGVIFLLILLFFFFSPSEPTYDTDNEQYYEEERNDDQENLTLNTTIPGQQEDIAENQTAPNSSLGNYSVIPKEWQIIKQDEDDILIVTYIFSNHSSSSASFMFSITDKAFQRGIECTDPFLIFAEDYFDPESDDVEIQPGYSLEVQKAYKLNDLSSPVEIELTEAFSILSSEKLTYTIDITEP